MSNAYLAPTLTFRSFTNNGLPNVGGTLTTYQAGTTTPLASYTDSTAGTPNANPLTLNARGEANVWIPPNVGYKFVEADSSGNIIKTTDQVNLPQLISLVAGADTGLVNAYQVTLVTPLSSYTNMGFYFIPANTNTGASTMNVSVNGGTSYLGPQAIVNPGGSPLVAGQLVAGNVYFLLYSGGNFILSTNVAPTGIVTVAGLNVNGSAIPADGIYLPAANTLGFSAGGVLAGSLTSAGLLSITSLNLGGVSVSASSVPAITVLGADVSFNSTTTLANVLSYNGSLLVAGGLYQVTANLFFSATGPAPGIKANVMASGATTYMTNFTGLFGPGGAGGTVSPVQMVPGGTNFTSAVLDNIPYDVLTVTGFVKISTLPNSIIFQAAPNALSVTTLLVKAGSNMTVTRLA